MESAKSRGTIVLVASSVRPCFLLIAASQRLEFGGRLLDRDAGRETGNGLGIARAGLDLGRREAGDFKDTRRKHLGRGKGRRQLRGQDAHDLPRLVVELNHFADERGSPAEARHPEFVAQDADRRTVRDVVLRREIAPGRGDDAERLEKLPAHAESVELQRLLTRLGQREAVKRADAQGRERPRGAAQGLKTRPGDGW